jgi:hypothetical protein
MRTARSIAHTMFSPEHLSLAAATAVVFGFIALVWVLPTAS